MSSPTRLIVYIDGFNLYYGLQASGYRRYLWLNLHALALSLTRPGNDLVCVKYFTSRIENNPQKGQRQNTFLEALGTLNEVQIYYGKYQRNQQTCKSCGAQTIVPREKMTDVNIAVQLLTDAYQDNFDIAMLISGDTDLVPPIQALRRLFPQKEIIVAFPPGCATKALKECASGEFTIGRAKFAQSQFPESVTRQDGFLLSRPAEWV